MVKEPEPPNPWCLGDDPLPADTRLLITQVKAYAQARRNDAARHFQPCTCLGCKIRKYHQARSQFTRRAT